MSFQSLRNHFSSGRLIRAFTRLLIAALLISPAAIFAQGPPQGGPDMTLDAKARTEVIEAIVKNLNDYYVFPEVAKKMEQAIRERVQKKEYDQVTSAKQFAGLLTDHLQQVSRDKHLRVQYSSQPIPKREGRQEPTPEEFERFNTSARRNNYGFEKIERLPGNIGYLDLRGFVDTEFGSETASAAMSYLSNADALIIDLRRNGGGSPAMVALISSYLFGPEPVHLNDLYWREGDTTRQWWTLPHVPGKRFGAKKPVYVLTSKRTFSAAEEFTYNLKNLKRATIIGETTGGGAHPGGGRRITDHFGMFIPTGRAINPISKTNWEGTGVKPDIDVPADHALKTAQVEALKKLVETTADQMWKDRLKQVLETNERELSEMKTPRPEAQMGSGPVVPDTPAGKKLSAWLSAINSGEAAAMKRFHAENASKRVLERNPADAMAQMDQQFYGDTGGLRLHSILRSSDNEIEALAQGKKNSEWIRIQIKVDPAPPNSIIGMGVEPGSAPSAK
jgi:retinol-binding protein 3